MGLARCDASTVAERAPPQRTSRAGLTGDVPAGPRWWRNSPGVRQPGRHDALQIVRARHGYHPTRQRERAAGELTCARVPARVLGLPAVKLSTATSSATGARLCVARVDGSTRPPSWSVLTTVWSDQCPVLVAGSLTNCCATRGRAAQPAQPGRHAGATQLVQTGVETTSAQLGTHRLMAHALIDALVDTPGLRVRFRCRGFDQTTRPHRRGRLASAAPSREGSACRAGSWCCVAPPV
jgi:hypothetical protein